MNTNDTTYLECNYSLDTSQRMFTVTQVDEYHSLVCLEKRFHGMSVAATPYIKKLYGLLRYVMVCAAGAVKILMVVMSHIVYSVLYICHCGKHQKALNTI